MPSECWQMFPLFKLWNVDRIPESTCVKFCSGNVVFSKSICRKLHLLLTYTMMCVNESVNNNYYVAISICAIHPDIKFSPTEFPYLSFDRVVKTMLRRIKLFRMILFEKKVSTLMTLDDRITIALFSALVHNIVIRHCFTKTERT